MNLSLIVVLGALSILTCWGVVAPRTQWRALAGWGTSGRSGDEPGAVIVGIHRAVAGIALVALSIGGGSVVSGLIDPNGRTHQRAIADDVRLLWGAPDPEVVNRVFVPVTTPPAGLTREKTLRFEIVSARDRNPGYLFSLPTYRRPHASTTDDYLGAEPVIGLVALDTADIVVQVRADRRCIPQQVFVVESGTAIAVAVYYGRPVGESLDAKALASPCDPKAAGDRSSSVLIPIDLRAAVGKRAVITLEGTPIPRAKVP